MRSLLAGVIAAVLIVTTAPSAFAGSTTYPIDFGRPATLVKVKGKTPGTACGSVRGQAIAQALATNKRASRSEAVCILRASTTITVPIGVTSVAVRFWGLSGIVGDCAVDRATAAFAGTFSGGGAMAWRLRSAGGATLPLGVSSIHVGCFYDAYLENDNGAIVRSDLSTAICGVISVVPGTTYRPEIRLSADATGVAIGANAWVVGRAEITHALGAYEFDASC